MAHIDMHYGYSINGVAYLHTEILKNSELKPFYEIYPEKFNNKTNGITFRRWLLDCNEELTSWIEGLIGNGFKKDATELEKLLQYQGDQKVLESLLQVKAEKKKVVFTERTERSAIWCEQTAGKKYEVLSLIHI